MKRTHMIRSLMIAGALSGSVFADAGPKPQANNSERLFLVSRPARRDVSKLTLVSTVTSVKVDDTGKVVSYEIASDQGSQIIKADTLKATHTEPIASRDLIENLKLKSADHFIDIEKASVDVLVKSIYVPTYRSDKIVLYDLERMLEHRPNYARTGLARYGNLNEASQYGKIDRTVKAPVDPRSLPVTADHYGSNVVDPKKHPNMTREEMGGVSSPVREAIKGATDDAVRE